MDTDMSLYLLVMAFIWVLDSVCGETVSKDSSRGIHYESTSVVSYDFCGEKTLVSDDRGLLHSPGFPINNYANNLNCSISIVAQEGRYVTMTLHYLRIQGPLTNPNVVQECTGNDYIELQGAKNLEPPYRLCGAQLMPYNQRMPIGPIVSKSNALNVTFISNRRYTQVGFNASFLTNHTSPLEASLVVMVFPNFDLGDDFVGFATNKDSYQEDMLSTVVSTAAVFCALGVFVFFTIFLLLYGHFKSRLSLDDSLFKKKTTLVVRSSQRVKKALQSGLVEKAGVNTGRSVPQALRPRNLLNGTVQQKTADDVNSDEISSLNPSSTSRTSQPSTTSTSLPGSTDIPSTGTSE